MPESAISQIENGVAPYANTAPIRDMVANIFVILREHNKFNFRANIFTCDLDPTSVDIRGLTLGEDYELDAMYRLSDGTEIAIDSFDDTYEEEKDKLFDLDSAVAEQEDIITEIEDHPTMPIAEQTAELVAARAELAAREAKRKEQDDLVDAYREADRNGPETNECMWNTVWIYSQFDKELAAEAGLGTGTFTGDHEHAGENFVHLLGCGMNLEPHICAYEALLFGAIDPCRVHQFADAGYCESVMGGAALFTKVCKILNIHDCLSTIQADQKERMAKFDEACTKAIELRKAFSEAGDPAMGQIAAMLTLSPHL